MFRKVSKTPRPIEVQLYSIDLTWGLRKQSLLDELFRLIKQLKSYKASKEAVEKSRERFDRFAHGKKAIACSLLNNLLELSDDLAKSQWSRVREYKGGCAALFYYYNLARNEHNKLLKSTWLRFAWSGTFQKHLDDAMTQIKILFPEEIKNAKEAIEREGKIPEETKAVSSGMDL